MLLIFHSCTMDTDCYGGMVCDSKQNLCRTKSKNTDYSFCSNDGIICKEGEGGCDSHIDCEGTLLCGTANCPSGLSDMNCCFGNFGIQIQRGHLKLPTIICIYSMWWQLLCIEWISYFTIISRTIPEHG